MNDRFSWGQRVLAREKLIHIDSMVGGHVNQIDVTSTSISCIVNLAKTRTFKYSSVSK